MISLEGARIEASLDGSNGTFSNDNGIAMVLDAARIDGFCVFAFAGFNTKEFPAITAAGTQIGGFLSLAAANINGSLMLRGVRIGANLNLSGIKIASSVGYAINLERANISGDFLIYTFKSNEIAGHKIALGDVRGSIYFVSTIISGSIQISSATISIAAGSTDQKGAIIGDGLQVGQYLSIVNTTIKGAARLKDLQVGRSVNLSGTRIENAGKVALDIERARIAGDMFIRTSKLPNEEPATKLAAISGGLVMTAAKIGGSLMIADDSLRNHDQSLLFNRIEVAGVFYLGDVFCGTGRLSLANAKVHALYDVGTAWPNRGSLLLNGFEYNIFSADTATSWRVRLDWLRRFKPREFNPQPYITLAAVLRRTGHDQDAKRVAIGRHREERKYLTIGSPRWFGNILMDITCGHGYRPWLAAMWVLIVTGIGTVVFDLDPSERTPLKEPAATLVRNGQPLPSGYPPFQALLYSADVLLPIVNLQQKEYWAPNSDNPRGRRARLYLPMHVLAGWFFTTLFVVGVTGLIRRD